MPALHPSRFALAEHKFNRWAIIQPAGEAFEEVLKPGYWAHVGASLRIGDEIRVINDEMNVYARLLVVTCERLWANVHVLDFQPIEAATEGGSSEYSVKVEWAGPHDKHRVFRMRDGQKDVLSAKHETKELALKWAAEHMKTVGATRSKAA